MDEVRSKGVIKVFVDLFEKSLLYRKKRMVNWDPEAKTVLSNEEVIYNSERANLYYVSYKIEGSDESIIIATTRPETILGDSAIAVHPEDDRYSHLKGKKAIVPMVDRAIPIIMDDYVEREFGTGALKVTPAHDVNDYEIGLRHNLDVIEILNPDGTLSETAELFVGLDREVARKEAIKLLKELGVLSKIEELEHNVGRSERTNVIVEPRLSLQWYVDMPKLAEKALEAVMTDEVEFFPKNQKNVYSHWMTNIRDWCISRQLWWGHRIPAWYFEDEVFVALTGEEALIIAKEKLNRPDLTLSDLRQEEDVLDTWFSSWIWPITVFNGFENEEEIKYYYPTSVLVTGWDIIFLWVARMIMAGYEWKNERPFEKVYFTGMVRDKQRRKMSKSLGNSPDALKLIDDFGADGVRFGMLSCSPAGGDLLFDEKLCEQGRNFSNKLWNALRLIKGWEVDDSVVPSEGQKYAVDWMNNLYEQIVGEIDHDFDQFRLSEGLIRLYSFAWNDFCSWFLESIKPEGGIISSNLLEEVISIYEKICLLLHPYMPFVTEEIWHQLRNRGLGDELILAQILEPGTVNIETLRSYNILKDVTSSIRDVRNKNQVKRSERLKLFVQAGESAEALLENGGWCDSLMTLAQLGSVESTDKEPDNIISFISGTEKFYVELNQVIDVESELERLKDELEYAQGFVKSVSKKLSNENFVQNAPEVVVEKERQKQRDGEERIKILEESIRSLRSK
jgi:valyl-tRNA synthetase